MRDTPDLGKHAQAKEGVEHSLPSAWPAAPYGAQSTCLEDSVTQAVAKLSQAEAMWPGPEPR